jgi:hypothetical protein
MDLNSKIVLYGGILLILIAIILGGLQHFGSYSFYGSNSDYKWPFYGMVACIGLIGIILAALPLMKKPAETKKSTEPAATS